MNRSNMKVLVLLIILAIITTAICQFAIVGSGTNNKEKRYAGLKEYIETISDDDSKIMTNEDFDVFNITHDQADCGMPYSDDPDMKLKEEALTMTIIEGEFIGKTEKNIEKDDDSNVDGTGYYHQRFKITRVLSYEGGYNLNDGDVIVLEYKEKIADDMPQMDEGSSAIMSVVPNENNKTYSINNKCFYYISEDDYAIHTDTFYYDNTYHYSGIKRNKLERIIFEYAYYGASESAPTTRSEPASTAAPTVIKAVRVTRSDENKDILNDKVDIMQLSDMKYDPCGKNLQRSITDVQEIEEPTEFYYYNLFYEENTLGTVDYLFDYEKISDKQIKLSIDKLETKEKKEYIIDESFSDLRCFSVNGNKLAFTCEKKERIIGCCPSWLCILNMDDGTYDYIYYKDIMHTECGIDDSSTLPVNYLSVIDDSTIAVVYDNYLTVYDYDNHNVKVCVDLLKTKGNKRVGSSWIDRVDGSNVMVFTKNKSVSLLVIDLVEKKIISRIDIPDEYDFTDALYMDGVSYFTDADNLYAYNYDTKQFDVIYDKLSISESKSRMELFDHDVENGSSVKSIICTDTSGGIYVARGTICDNSSPTTIMKKFSFK